MFASPLLLGCDLTKIDSFTMSLITNDHVIALNQDRLGKQAVLVKQKNNIQIWKKELADGSIAIAIVNLSNKEKKHTFDLKSVTNNNYTTATDLWINQRLDIVKNNIDIVVPSHGVSLIKLK
jgi:alpha-galactosidase